VGRAGEHALDGRTRMETSATGVGKTRQPERGAVKQLEPANLRLSRHTLRSRYGGRKAAAGIVHTVKEGKGGRQRRPIAVAERKGNSKHEKTTGRR